MTFRVLIQPRAEAEAQRIFAWLAERSPEGAVRWYDAYVAAVESLRTDPESRPTALESPLQGHIIRQQLFRTPKGRTYRLLYLVITPEAVVRVLYVRGPGQNAVQ